MSSPEFLTEDRVTTSELTSLFKRAFFKTSLDSDGDLVVQTDGPKVCVMVNEGNKLIKFLSMYGLNENGSLQAKHALVNRMNEDKIFARFSVPRDDVLMADYFLPYEEGILAFQVVTALRLFARVVPAAIRSCDVDDLVK